MYKFTRQILFITALVIASGDYSAAEAPPGPAYASMQSHRAIENMIAAHGGKDAWYTAPSISYDFIMYLPYVREDGMSSWDVWSHELAVTEPKTGRGYIDLPMEDASLVTDGDNAWSIELGENSNPPRLRLKHHYRFVNLPWITQQAGTIFGKPGKGRLPNDEIEYTTIKMTFDPRSGRSAAEYHILYIDPETNLFKGSEYVVTYAAVLDAIGVPEKQKFFGPLVRIVEEYATEDGLTVPSRYTTYNKASGQAMGMHMLYNVSFKREFDETRMNMPETAVVDNTDPVNRKNSLP